VNETETDEPEGDGRDGARKKVLAIDDEPDVLSFLRLALEKSGYQALTAPNGTEGLIRAHVERPDLILLDIMMEDMDGWETLRLLKLDETSRDVPVIVVSARAETKDKIRALQEGAIDYITKPFSMRDSLGKIRAILESSPGRDHAEDGEVRD
jgi:DNA-binding response OmpR family regulator